MKQQNLFLTDLSFRVDGNDESVESFEHEMSELFVWQKSGFPFLANLVHPRLNSCLVVLFQEGDCTSESYKLKIVIIFEYYCLHFSFIWRVSIVVLFQEGSRNRFTAVKQSRNLSTLSDVLRDLRHNMVGSLWEKYFSRAFWAYCLLYRVHYFSLPFMQDKIIEWFKKN